MLKLCRITKVKVFPLVLVYIFNLTYLNFRLPFWRRVYYLRTQWEKVCITIVLDIIPSPLQR